MKIKLLSNNEEILILYEKIIFLSFSIFLFYFIIQIDISINLLKEDGVGLLSIIIGQSYNLGIAIMVSLIFIPFSANKLGRICYIVIIALFIIYLIVDRHFYALMFDHIQSGYLEGDANVSLMKDSIIAQFNSMSFFYLFIGIIWMIWIHRIINIQTTSTFIERCIKNKYIVSTSLIVLIIYSIYGHFNILKNDHHHLSVHPLITLVKTSFFHKKDHYPTILLKNDTDLFKLKFGTFDKDEQENKFFKQYLLDRFPSRPNVIFILLESTGAKNIFQGESFNELDSLLTPNLNALKNNTFIFPYIYTQVPATTRTQFTISTGGHDMTYGSSTELLKYKFTGPTIFNSFKAAGYETGMFSAQLLLDASYVYDKSPIDFKFIPDLFPEQQLIGQRLNSWGIKEEYASNSLISWLDNRNTDQPFFIQFNTSCTHHPYNYPASFATKNKGTATQDYYKNALGYTDQIIGSIIKALRDKKLEHNTIIALCGDHGESFGDWHKTNLLHKSFIYEENVRSFLLWIDQGQIKTSYVSNRKGSIGDVAPTLTSILHQKNNMPGQNLFSNPFSQSILYFYKNANPSKWGLLDGEWKFIHNQENDEQVELYQLTGDPNEQINLATKFPDRIKTYNDMCRNWYISKHKQLAPFLSGYEPYYFNHKDLTYPGPKQIEIGIAFENKPFRKLDQIHPEGCVGVYTRGTPFKENTIIKYSWISPSGKKHIQYFEHDSKWSTTWINCNIPRPLENGIWTIVLSKEIDGKELISTQFEVSQKAKLEKKFVVPWLEHVVFAKIDHQDKKNIQNTFRPGDSICVIMQSKIHNESHRLILRWLSPSGQIENNVGVYYQAFDYEKNWAYGWVNAPSAAPYEKGRWMISIFDNMAQELLYSAWFEVE